jgi:hypothetical protein
MAGIVPVEELGQLLGETEILVIRRNEALAGHEDGAVWLLVHAAPAPTMRSLARTAESAIWVWISSISRRVSALTDQSMHVVPGNHGSGSLVRGGRVVGRGAGV